MRLVLAVLTAMLALPAAAQQTSGSIEIESPLEGRKKITPDWAAINTAPLGSKGNPVRVHTPNGQRAYLTRLICANGSAPTFRRAGSFGVGVYGAIIDGYDVDCSGTRHMVYLDMYHPDYIEKRAVPSFTIRAP